MATAVLFIGWDRPLPTVDPKKAYGHLLVEGVPYLRKLEGKAFERIETIALTPHGGDLNGFIALFGIAVQNGVIMVTYINHLREHKSLEEAIIEGAVTRLRPVMITALVASLGLFPLILSTGTGAEVQRPMATVVVGGLVTATILTLVVLPSIYYVWNERRERKQLQQKQA
jgi:hypothetical protein